MNPGKSYAVAVSILVPAYNEEQLIFSFLKSVTEVAEKLHLKYEIIVIENGSSDKTADEVLKFSKRKNTVKLIHLKKAGYGLAILSGIKRAAGKYMVIFNVDFWDEKLLMLVNCDLLKYDIISGSKCLPGSLDLRGLNRKIVTKSFNYFLRLIIGFRGTDTHGIKILRSSMVIPVIKQCKITSGLFDSELMIRAQRNNLKVLELPVEVKELRSSRFRSQRIFATPHEIYRLWKALR